MSDDARFEDASPRPLNLGAMDPDDLAILSALALLLNRLRHEEPRAEVERVQSVLVIENALGVASQGITRGDADTVLQVLALAFVPGEEGAGFVEITFAGDGAIRAEVEALEARVKDVTRPYLAPSGKRPEHPE